MFYISPLPFLDPVFDLTTLFLIASLFFLSILSLCFIFHLRFKSKSIPHLQNFNSIWTVRFVLILSNSLWAITELFRLPLFRRNYLYPFLPDWSITLQSVLCKIHVVLSLGLFEPAFLITLLFLVKASIKKRSPNDFREISLVLMACFPILVFQIMSIFFSPLNLRLPDFFTRTSIVWKNGFEEEMALCSYPLLNTIVFGIFGIGYEIWFLFTSWKVLSLVINKGLRLRLYGLSMTVLLSLPMQIVLLGLSAFWLPSEPAFIGLVMIIFLSTFSRAVVVQGILVIKPIADALDAGGENFHWRTDSWSASRSRKLGESLKMPPWENENV